MEPQTPSPSPSPPDSPSDVAHVEFKAIVLLVLITALICGFLLYVMYARGVFEKTQQLVLIADNSEGVIAGMDLTFSGFPIGRVRRIELAADGKARILIDVPRKDAHWLRTSSIFTMERGMVGETRLRAFSGMLNDPPLPENSERGVLSGDTNAEIPRLVATARTLLENLDNMTRSDSSLNTSLGHLQTMSARLNGRYGMLTGVLGSEDNAKKIITTLDSANALLAKADQRVFGANGLMDSTQATVDGSQAAVKQLTAMLTDVRASLQKVDAVLVEAQAVGANARVASADLGALRAEVEISLRKVSQLVDEVNRKWPFARDTELKLP
ncbi:MlaD family protein [Rhodoferax sp.]|uniref:MlaD family protein n=1 Tax=Rhodoferax sp. TaxID=50421 RepID=UPI002725B9C1|nr:mammalian cell entry protein [Rhodoferax sp.]MDO9196353.1 mammalian cell entry protein [Rhodoferax sp.]